ncbi:MAG: exodeoxyribonuclease VII large subunit [Eubacteriales bacterium]|nr:exodeoxyribonuclease VII large subunit [Eubacteriales bacterium]
MAQDILTVTQLNMRVANKIKTDSELNGIKVEGEISEPKVYRSGHCYFTLKDEDSNISCIAYASDYRKLSFTPRAGDKVVALGRCNLYTKEARFQLIVQSLEPIGEGELYRRFIELKNRLEAQGYFALENKQKIPWMPKRVAFVSSPQGAVIHDFVSIARRRFPNFDLLLVPAKVQGEGSAESLIRGLKLAEAKEDIELIVLARGGGSLQDLWSFNEAALAEAIFKCKKPVISAVGHESDFTIADFVADLRAPTPSAAAELLYPSLAEIYQTLDRVERRILRIAYQSLSHSALKLSQLQRRLQLLQKAGGTSERNRYDLAFKGLSRQGNELKLKLSHEARKLDLTAYYRSIKERLRQSQLQIKAFDHRLQQAVQIGVKREAKALEAYSRQLQGLSPFAVLERGYAVALDSKGELIRSPRDLADGSQFDLVLESGRILARKEKTISEEGRE